LAISGFSALGLALLYRNMGHKESKKVVVVPLMYAAITLSNLQQEYIDTAREAIKIGTSAQKQLINSSNNNKIELPAITAPFVERFVDQSKDLTSNMIGITDLNAQFAINALNATRENLKNNRRMVKAAVEFNSNIANAWVSSLSPFQMQFTNRQS
jgi:hypothetical protein